MSGQLLGVIVGGGIGIIGGLASTVLIRAVENRRRKKAIRALVQAELENIADRCHRYLAGRIDRNGLRASKPIWQSFMPEVAFLTAQQAVASRKAIGLSKEAAETGSKEIAERCLSACKRASELLKSNYK